MGRRQRKEDRRPKPGELIPAGFCPYSQRYIGARLGAILIHYEENRLVCIVLRTAGVTNNSLRRQLLTAVAGRPALLFEAMRLGEVQGFVFQGDVEIIVEAIHETEKGYDRHHFDDLIVAPIFA